MEETRLTLIEERQKHFSSLTETTLLDLDLLIDRLSRKGLISPLDYFDVNNSCFLSMAGTIITYLIVLMQFKVSE